MSWVLGLLALAWRLRTLTPATRYSDMDSSSLQASFALAPVPTAHVHSASDFGIDSMQGHDGLFARRLPIASTCSTHLWFAPSVWHSRCRGEEESIPLLLETDCTTCSMKAKCCPNTAFRKIARSVHEAARDAARRIAATPAYQRSRHERKKVEMLFAHLKRILKLDRLRLRGTSGATDECTLAAAVQNLRWLAKFTSQGPPATG